jgi:cyanophycin synthetase
MPNYVFNILLVEGSVDDRALISPDEFEFGNLVQCSNNLIDEDIKECAKIAGRMFDHIIIRQEKHLRGRTEEEIIALIMEGVSESGRNVTHEIITKEVEAIKHAINSAEEGTFITALSDVVTNAIEIVQEYLDKENEQE